MTKATKNWSNLYFKILKTWKNWESTRITSIPFPFLRTHFPFPVAKSQSQQPKSHFSSLKIDQSQFPFYPFRTLISNFSQHLYVFSDHTLPTRVSLSKIRWPRRTMTYLIFTVVCLFQSYTRLFFFRITRDIFSKNYTKRKAKGSQRKGTFFQELHATLFPRITHDFFPRITRDDFSRNYIRDVFSKNYMRHFSKNYCTRRFFQELHAYYRGLL